MNIQEWVEQGKPINEIVLGDCLEGMSKMDNDSVDIVITSPPYNLGNSIRGNLYADYGDDLSQDEYYHFISNVLKELIRVTKYYVFFNFQILTGNKLAYLKIFSDFKENIKETIIWVKKQVAPASQPTCLSSQFEFVVVFAKKELAEKRTFERAFFNNRVKGQGSNNVIIGNNMSAANEFNAEKGSNKACYPQYLVRWFLKRFSQEGDIVLDPFMGSCTTALVCQQMNRKYLGFEIDAEYVKVGVGRLSQKGLGGWVR